MKSLKILFATALLLLAACVTINIYFPAAEAREAAEKIVDDVLGKDAKQPATPAPAPGKDDQSMHLHRLQQGYAMSLLDILIPPSPLDGVGQPRPLIASERLPCLDERAAPGLCLGAPGRRRRESP